MSVKLSYNLVNIPLVTPFRTSFGVQNSRTSYIFTLEHEGIKAYSECVTDLDPYYSYEDNSTAIHVIKNYLSAKINDFPHPEEFLERASGIKGHNMAKAALETLLWDYHSKSDNVPLYKYLGKTRGHVDVGVSLGMQDSRLLLDAVHDSINKGYKRIKVKIQKGREVQILSTVRNSFPDTILSADANCDYTLEDLSLIKKLDEFNLAYLEQPLAEDDLIDHTSLRKNIRTPICLDESITSPDKARKAFQIGAVDIVNIKPGRVGGLTNSLQIAKLSKDYGGHSWVGGMLETGIGRSFNIALASNELIDLPGDTSPNERYFLKDIVKNPFKMEKGIIAPFELPGIGVIIDEDALERYTLEKGIIDMPGA